MDNNSVGPQSHSHDDQFFEMSSRPGKQHQSAKSGGQGFVENIPLEEYRGDTLKKIHAQSSAETSGLGDSLQRIHALSSTETSGYGDGDGYYCCTPSPEIGHALPPLPLEHEVDLGLGSQQNLTAEAQLPSQQQGVYNNDNGDDDDEIDGGLTKGAPSVASSTNNYKRGTRVHHNRSVLTDQLGTAGADRCSSSGGSVIGFGGGGDSGRKNKRRRSCSNSSQRQDWGRTHSTSPHMTSAMRGAEHTGLPRAMSIDAEVSAITNEAQRRGDRADSGRQGGISPMVRSESQGSLRAGRNSFLGKDMASTWLKWSQERRVSFKRRMSEMEARQKELEEQRMSTPVRKARKESIMFVAPEMEREHIPGDEDLQIHERLQNYMPTSKTKKKGDKEENKISSYHWNTLVMFWEHPLFIRCRIGGIALGSVALVITIISLTNQNWSHYQDHDYYGASHSGLWLICSSIDQSSNCTNTFRRDWQYAVIGLLIFSTTFGFLATMLGVCGLCTAALPRKLYYYHSAGEIYLICAISLLAAVLLYPFANKAEMENTSHRHGLGFILAWVSIFVFDLSALCMCLDEIMRALTKLRQSCDRQSRTRV